MTGYQIREVHVARYSGGLNGGPSNSVQKFYQTFVVQRNGSSDCYLIYNWGAGAEGRPHDDPRGQLQLVTTGPITYSRANSLAAMKLDEKYKKGYVHYTTFGVGANIIVPPKIEDLIQGIGNGGAPVIAVTEVQTVLDCLRRAGALFSGEASAGFILANRQPGESMVIRQGLALSLAEMHRLIIQSQASLELIDEALGID